ncbi:MAG: uncharacterized protein A8A55_2287 [Amphiamblys sp. WSBS2006]|nr:MAG: uncharacterized protein A8A55_2463 [Amphiamblys sp. WSBS2006]OIR56964.1 MAG: uncharacterized protein A8A55_2287 [Amphiamblys sp. WSBS2006]
MAFNNFQVKFSIYIYPKYHTKGARKTQELKCEVCRKNMFTRENAPYQSEILEEIGPQETNKEFVLPVDIVRGVPLRLGRETKVVLKGIKLRGELFMLLMTKTALEVEDVTLCG